MASEALACLRTSFHMIRILESQRPSMFTVQNSLCRGLWRRGCTSLVCTSLVCTSLVCTSLHMTLLRMYVHVAGRASVSLRAPRAAPSFQRHRTPALRLHPQPPSMKLAMVASFEDMVAAAGTWPYSTGRSEPSQGGERVGATCEFGRY
jgi:hypothetical protein